MKKQSIQLAAAALLLLASSATVATAVIHSIGDNSVDNQPQHEANQSPAIYPTVSPVQTEQATKGDAQDSNAKPARANHSPSPSNENPDACGSAKADAEKAGWKLLSCDPLRLMSLEEWNQKSASPNFRYRPELYCFDESNFAGIFQEQLGEDDGTGYYPDWLSEMKLENGCSFFFHPNQGHGNGAPDERG